jgi:prepilin-type processing-associated H-X9-DG protein/prepilin-type N-terminal cleavage/methylation domain-containing protein
MRAGTAERMSCRECNQPGFTLIEALVVVSIVGILTLLMLSAVQAAREAARKAACVNNLKQFGIALQHYESTFGVLPRGEMGYSPHVMLLPQLELGAVYNAINFTSPIKGVDAFWFNTTIFHTRIGVFVCPSDPDGSEWSAVNHYAMNAGAGFDLYDSKKNGPFAYVYERPGTSLGMVTDGTSHTAASTEWLISRQPPVRDARRSTFITSRKLSAPSQFDQFAEACHSLPIATASLVNFLRGTEWQNLAFGQTKYNHVLPPNGRNCKNFESIEAFGAWTAGSMHPGGANVLYVDGHVAFTRETISWGAWRAIGTMNGQEVVGDSEKH